MMSIALTAIICTHNPRQDVLTETIASIRAQEPLGDGNKWEFLIVDNASDLPLESRLDLSWHPEARIVHEERLGLTNARLRSFRESKGDIIVYIDDDNVLDPNYLHQALAALEADATLGAVGGKSIPRFEVDPPDWFYELGASLACRDLGDAPIYASWKGLEMAERAYPECAPIGAGMAIRRQAYAGYIEDAETDPRRVSLGRKGTDLASGEDNDMILSLLSQGWRVAYLPDLRLEHLIPARRLSRDYLARYSQSSNRTWIQVLDVYGIRPWPEIPGWSVPLRKAKAFLAMRAWANDLNFIRWKGACGQFDGRAQLASSPTGLSH